MTQHFLYMCTRGWIDGFTMVFLYMTNNLPHLCIDRVKGKESLGRVHSALFQRAQMSNCPGLPLLLVSSCLWWVEPGPELIGAQEIFHFPTHKYEMDVFITSQHSCNVHHRMLYVAIPLPRLHTLAYRALRADVEDGAANRCIGVLRRLRFAGLG